MAYSIEDRDIVLKGFEEGIFDDPYKGIYDMRNVDIVSIPGEASIAMKTQATALQSSVTFSGETVTVDYSTNVFTHDGSTTLTVGQMIYFYTEDAGKDVWGNVTSGSAYYVKTTPTPTTFTISATPSGAEVDIINVAALTLTKEAEDTETWSAVTSKACTTLLDDPTLIGYLAIMTIKTTGSQPTFASSSQWTTVGTATQGSNYFSQRYCIVDGTQTADFTLSFSSGTGVMKIHYVKAQIPFNATPVEDTSYGTSAVNDVSVTGISTAKQNSILTYFTIANGEAGDGNNWTVPTLDGNSWSVLDAGGGAGGNYEMGLLQVQRVGASGSAGTLTMTTDTSNDKTGFVIAIPYFETGTVKMASINMAEPKQLYTGLTTLNEYMYFCLDTNGRLWVYDNDTTYMNGTNTWLYLNNKSSNVASATAGMVVWKGYIFVFDSSGVNYTQLAAYDTMFGAWVYDWQSALTSGVDHDAIVSDNDDRVYFCNGNKVGRLYENSGFTFNPATPTTYTYSASAMFLLEQDRATCLSDLGSNLLVGGSLNLVYVWDAQGFAEGYSSVIRLSENYISNIVTINTTSYIFAGYKGRIFMTNGSNATPFYKIPEYLSNVTNPYFIWKDATYNNNQLYFSFTCTTNSGTTINEYGGVWAVNVDSSAPSYPRLQNKLSYNTYAGSPTCFTQDRGLTFASNPSANGYGLFIGWNDGVSGFGIDKSISTPYTGGEAYIIFDPIPVGSFKTKRTFENLEYKLSQFLVANESASLYYRYDLTSAFTEVPITSGNSTGDISGLADTVNFENAQWLQIKIVLNGTATNPTYVRLREVRIR